ncbi:MAG TPA: NAD(P)-binding domain-containing protein [Candidatus Limnocylindrales bacterium]
MPLPARIDAVVVGAGQAGLITSGLLNAAGRDHLVLERRKTLGGSWQDRWDSFRIVTPNWSSSFPGAPYDGDDPDGFMTRDEISGRVARYAETIHAPVELDTDVVRLSSEPDVGFRLETNQGDLRCARVIVASGPFRRPNVPAAGAALPRHITQLHSHDYRNEAALPPGAVLVVGGGQSGTQIAEELQEAGRTVFMAVGNAPLAPRRYRGRDIFWWLAEIAARGPALGVELPTVDRLASPRLRVAANVLLSGHHGGHEMNLRRIAAGGITMLGHFQAVDGRRIRAAPDLAEILIRSEAFFGERIQPLIERFIELAEIDAPPDRRVPFDFQPPEVTEIDLDAAGVSTVIWATGYRPDFTWIDLPIFDDMDFPIHRRGVTDVPGLGFVGLLWQHTQVSATLVGPALDAPHVLETI